MWKWDGEKLFVFCVRNFWYKVHIRLTVSLYLAAWDQKAFQKQTSEGFLSQMFFGKLKGRNIFKTDFFYSSKTRGEKRPRMGFWTCYVTSYESCKISRIYLLYPYSLFKKEFSFFFFFFYRKTNLNWFAEFSIMTR